MLCCKQYLFMQCIASGKWGVCGGGGWRMEREGYKKVQYYQAQYMSNLSDFQVFFLLLFFVFVCLFVLLLLFLVHVKLLHV